MASQAVSIYLVFFQNSLDINRLTAINTGDNLVLALTCFGHNRFKALRINKVMHAYTDTLGLVHISRANTLLGGTDIIAAVINKYRDISLGRVIMMVDLIIITSSYVVLHDWERIIYGYVALIVSSLCVDQVVNSMRRSVQFFIISDKYKEIGERINHDPHRGVTVVNAQGFYSGNEVKMLFVLAKKNESHKIFQLINEIDPNAFVSQSAVIGVYGEGFDHIKGK